MQCRHCDNDLRFRRHQGDGCEYYFCDHCEIHVWKNTHGERWSQTFLDSLDAVVTRASAAEERELEKLALEQAFEEPLERDLVPA